MRRVGASLLGAVRSIENNHALDPIAQTLLPPAGGFAESRTAEALRGKWLGHAFHPLLTDFAEGPWMGATFLDLFGPPASATSARRLMGAGLLFALPTYVTGLAEMTNARNQKRIARQRIKRRLPRAVDSLAYLYPPVRPILERFEFAREGGPRMKKGTGTLWRIVREEGPAGDEPPEPRRFPLHGLSYAAPVALAGVALAAWLRKRNRSKRTGEE